MSLKYRFFTSSVLYAAAGFIPAGINLFALPVFATHLAPTDFGLIESFIILSTLLVAVSRLGLPGAVMRLFVDLDGPEQSKLVMTALVASISSGFVVAGCLILMTLSFDIMAIREQGVIIYLGIFLLANTLNAPFDVANRILQIRERPALSTMAVLIVFVINLSAKLGFVIILGFGYKGLVFAELISTCVMAFLAIYFLWRHLGGRFNFTVFREAISYGLPLSFHHLGSWMLTYSSAFLIPSLLTAHALGVYAIASKIVLPAGMIIDAITKSFMPIYYKQRSKSSTITTHALEISLLFFWLSLCAVVIISFAAPFLLIQLFPKDFHEGIPVIPALCAAQIFNLLYRLKTAELFYSKKTAVLPKITVFAGLVGLTSAYALISSFGLLGAGLAAMVGSLTQFLMVTYFTRKTQAIRLQFKQIIAVVFALMLLFSVDFI